MDNKNIVKRKHSIKFILLFLICIIVLSVITDYIYVLNLKYQTKIDKELLKTEQNLLELSIQSSQDEIHSIFGRRFMIQELMQKQLPKPKRLKLPEGKDTDKSQEKFTKQLEELDQQEKDANQIWDYATATLKTNLQLQEKYDTPERVQFEIEHAEQILSKQEIPEMAKIRFDYLFRRHTESEVLEKLSFWKAARDDGQDPFISKQNYTVLHKLVALVNSPLTYFFFVAICLPLGLIFGREFSSGRINFYLQIYSRKIAFNKFIRSLFVFWIICILIYIVGASFSTQLTGFGDSQTLMQLKDQSMITQGQFIKERLPLFILFSLQMLVLLLYLTIRNLSILPIQFGVAFIVMLHLVLNSFSTGFSLWKWQPFVFFEMNYGIGQNLIVYYSYLIATIITFVFLQKARFLNYEAGN